MKRCSQCLFLYPDVDERCDFDKTPLEVVDEAAVEAATHPVAKRQIPPLAAAIAIMAGVLAFVVFYGISLRRTSVATQNPAIVAPVASPEPVITILPSPSPSPSVSPSPSPSPSPKPSIAPNTASSHTRATRDFVSTGGPDMGTKQGGKSVIVLTSGSKIDADEVWRTKDGVWYRRNGMVTLLKRSQVKAILTK